jgi:hypothetical protein
MAKAAYRANPATVEKYLSGVDYPASRRDLINQAKKNNANEDVIDTISNLPDTTFNSPIDISKAMGKKEVEFTGAPHEKRGLQAASRETRERVAHAGGAAPHEKRGLQAASRETRERVAHAGGEASVSTSTAVSAAEVQKFLKGMDYPAGKQDVISQAQKNNAPSDVINVLGKINDRQFNSAADVSKAIGDVL